jgi:hypothetical protein
MKPTNYLRFPSEENWKNAALTLGVAQFTQNVIEEETIDKETGEIIPAVYEEVWTWNYYTHQHSCDVIGTIYNDDGVYNEETGEVISEPTPMEGFHVNYIGDLSQELHQYLVTPETPNRKFAGSD